MWISIGKAYGLHKVATTSQPSSTSLLVACWYCFCFFLGFIQVEIGDENTYTHIAQFLFPLSIFLLLTLLTYREIKKIKE